MNVARLNTIAVLGLAVAAGAGGVASAQVAHGDQNVRERHNSEYDPVGMPAGGFRFFPSITGQVETNDNVFAQQVNTIDDVAYVLSAQAKLISQWSRHELSAQASIDDTSYADLSSEDDVAWNAGINGALDISRATRLEASAFYVDTFEPRGENDPPNLLEPFNYTDLQGSLALSQQFNRFKISGAVNASDLDYEDGALIGGGVFDQDFRDRTQTEAALRGDFELSPDTALFISVADRWNEYENSNRDYDRQRVLAGGVFDITNLLQGEIGVGYSWVNFDSPAFGDYDGFSMNGSVNWFVTRITTVSLTGSRDVADSGDPRVGSSSKVVTNYGARVDHEFRRNIVLWLSGDWAKDDYKGIDRDDDVTSASVGADWLVNRWASVRGRFEHTELDTSGADARLLGDFDQNRWTLGVTLRR